MRRTGCFFLTTQILLSIENKSHDVTGGAGKQIRFSEHQRDQKKSTIQAQGNMYTKIESHCETILLLDEFCNICSSIYYAILKNGYREKTNLHSSIDGINKEN